MSLPAELAAGALAGLAVAMPVGPVAVYLLGLGARTPWPTAAAAALGVATVDVDRVVRTNLEPTRRHDPNHPLADTNGDVWVAGVDQAAEMIDMVEAARQYQNNVQVLQTAKTLMLDTLRLGQ